MAAVQPPTLNEPLATIADWTELETWLNPDHRVRAAELLSLAGVEAEPGDKGQIEADTERELLVDEVFSELGRRSDAAEGRYPFTLSTAGDVLHLRAFRS